MDAGMYVVEERIESIQFDVFNFKGFESMLDPDRTRDGWDFAEIGLYNLGLIHQWNLSSGAPFQERKEKLHFGWASCGLAFGSFGKSETNKFSWIKNNQLISFSILFSITWYLGVNYLIFSPLIAMLPY